MDSALTTATMDVAVLNADSRCSSARQVSDEWWPNRATSPTSPTSPTNPASPTCTNKTHQTGSAALSTTTSSASCPASPTTYIATEASTEMADSLTDNSNSGSNSGGSSSNSNSSTTIGTTAIDMTNNNHNTLVDTAPFRMSCSSVTAATDTATDTATNAVETDRIAVIEAPPSRAVNPLIVRMIAAASGINGKKNQLFPDCSLGIIERYFHHSPSHQTQVIMAISLRLRLPPQAEHISETRILDLLKLAQAKHFRLASHIDYESHNATLLGRTAADLHLLHRFVPSHNGSGSDVWRRVMIEELNAHFDLYDPTVPLWRVAIVAPPSVAGDGIQLIPSSATANSPSCMPPTIDATSPISFDLVFTFHHCIGDGLSMLAFARTFLAECTAANFNALSLHLDQVPVSTEPPLLLDNYIRPSFFGIFPAIFGLLPMLGYRYRLHRFRHLLAASLRQQHLSSSRSSLESFSRLSISSTTPLLTAPAKEPTLVSTPCIPFDPVQKQPIHSDAQGVSDPQASPRLKLSYDPLLPTQSRFLMYDAAFVTDLLKHTKANHTTIAAVLIVASLACVRAIFADTARSTQSHLPRYQGWVATTSLRHLIPGSLLLHGVDKQNDAATMVFGGYSGSISEMTVGVDDRHEFWERCRRVRRTIGSGGAMFTAMRRAKLLNWVYRRPGLFKKLIHAVDVKHFSHGYSVEVANLGAWAYPTASASSHTLTQTSNANATQDTRAVLEWFGGTLNASFEGSRGLFTLGVITLGNDMSVAITYDRTVVSEDLADRFVSLFDATLYAARQSLGSRIKLGDMPCSCGGM
ncbi:hypothetical protein BASA50_009587 [Batrachochytrium salamandrivorans]|uniref:O-acyltransferase WSD1 C-terminal domain-containing protein n=1 Tax=Batrachochytrium salamandrivorans TaxID=1357716 RepID=A0ABQ8F0Z1_9FUNG|nr:hypothetical protein BASA50_009587 [Batrachochytrium salamandrivorans]KAH9266433.1 hypothetical protein BASA83_010551 [Batrachochytrium salamandrivorans]